MLTIRNWELLKRLEDLVLEDAWRTDKEACRAMRRVRSNLTRLVVGLGLGEQMASEEDVADVAIVEACVGPDPLFGEDPYWTDTLE